MSRRFLVRQQRNRIRAYRSSSFCSNSQAASKKRTQSDWLQRRASGALC